MTWTREVCQTCSLHHQRHITYTEDARNTGTVRHAVRSYPLRNRTGQPVPNHYLVGFEEAANGDYQDYLFVIGNVVPVTN